MMRCAIHIRGGRCGSAAVSSVLVLILLQVVVVASIVVGTRDQDTTVHRLDSTRAFYAAEAAMNMGIREMMEYVDDDNDGQSGGVSNDGIPGTDVALATARSFTARDDSTIAATSGRMTIGTNRNRGVID